jgi:Plasmid pRiA4b ORF-3-like protein
MPKTGRIYQFKIVLQDTAHPVWRRIQVPEEYTFWDLHIAIQDVIGWQDGHLHEFRIQNPVKGQGTIGIPSDDGKKSVYPGWEHKVSGWFYPGRRTAQYIYELGDGWEHDITLEATVLRRAGAKYPRCTGGAGACPPEDSGGPSSGADLVARDDRAPKHYEHIDPGNFDPAAVKFTDPKKRLKRLLGC